jgi:ABC-2 type transport system permease protein
VRAILTIAGKDLRLLWRDRIALFWVFALPLFIAVLFGMVYSGAGAALDAMPVAVVDADGSQISQRFVSVLQDSPALAIAVGDDTAPARDAVRRGDLVAAVVLRPGFGRALGAPGVFDDAVAELELWVDPARRAEVGVLRGIVAESFQQLGAVAAESPAEPQADNPFAAVMDPSLDLPSLVAKPPKILLRPITEDREAKPANAFEVSFPAAIIWGLIACAGSFAVSIARERSSGTLQRLCAAPLGMAQILAGKGTACFATGLLAMAVLLAIGRFGFDVRLNDPAALLAAMVSAAACFVGLMMLISQFGRSEMAVNGANWGIMMVLAMLGGAMVPIFSMPAWLQAVGAFSPVRWAILAFEGALWRGFDAAEMARPCGILLAVGVVAFALGAMLLRRREA